MRIGLRFVLTKISTKTNVKQEVIFHCYPDSVRNKAGRRWIGVGGSLMQVDSGPFGIVWGVNRRQNIFFRTGITWRNPKGNGLAPRGGRLKYISCGEFGCWGVNRRNKVFFSYGVSRKTPQG